MIIEVFLFILILAFLWSSTRKPSTMPPGSYGWPILGELPTAKVSISEHMSQLRQKYGNIFTTKWGAHPIVVISDSNLIKKAFQHPDLQGRPQFLSVQIMMQSKNAGLIFSGGSVWAENRRFVLRHLRDLGMGKTALETAMQDETVSLVDYLEKNCVGKPAVMDLAINGAVINVLWLMAASKRYDLDDPEILHYNAQTEGMMCFAQRKMLPLDVLPYLHRILPDVVQNKLMDVDKGTQCAVTLHKMSERCVREHMQSLDPDTPRDLIDQFILQNGDPKSNYSLKETDMKNLTCTMMDLFNAGNETTSTSIRWMILYMALHPQIQAKVQKCLDETVPRSRLPGLSDRSQLPYMDAMLLEVLRLSSIAAHGLTHRATADVSFEGYVIPKDTLVMACLKHCHLSSAAWDKPNEFYPEHFLAANGELDSKKDSFLPFSVGRRQCLGESMARMQLYLFGSAILQRFKIEPPEGVTLSADVDPTQMILSQPLPYKVVLRKRY